MFSSVKPFGKGPRGRALRALRAHISTMSSGSMIKLKVEPLPEVTLPKHLHGNLISLLSDFYSIHTHRGWQHCHVRVERFIAILKLAAILY